MIEELWKRQTPRLRIGNNRYTCHHAHTKGVFRDMQYIRSRVPALGIRAQIRSSSTLTMATAAPVPPSLTAGCYTRTAQFVPGLLSTK